MRYCGREFTDEEIARIRRLAAEPGMNRRALSVQVCEEFGWRKPDGGLKEMSCRVALLRMQADGLVRLPAPLCGSNNGSRSPPRTPQAEPQALSGDRRERPAGVASRTRRIQVRPFHCCYNFWREESPLSHDTEDGTSEKSREEARETG